MMSDTQPTQAAGGGADKGKPDGVEDTPGKTSPGGESGGGNYEAPRDGGKDGGSGFMAHGGQSHIAYSGDTDDDEEKPNAATE